MKLRSIQSLAIVAVIAVSAAVFASEDDPASLGGPRPEMIKIAESVIQYQLSGEYLVGGRPMPAPLEQRRVEAFRIMKAQVSLAEYGACVAAGDCSPADATVPATGSQHVPVTGVSYLDAEAYASWMSKTSGETWRLPTDVEMAVAAAERFAILPATQADNDAANPADRWLRLHREAAAANRISDAVPRPRGAFGANTRGLEDFGGNIWEWTSTCYEQVMIGAAGEGVQSSIVNCGVHVLQGRHRIYMFNFDRHGKSIAHAGTFPPDNLGFRLVLDERTLEERLWSALGHVVRAILPSSA